MKSTKWAKYLQIKQKNFLFIKFLTADNFSLKGAVSFYLFLFFIFVKFHIFSIYNKLFLIIIDHHHHMFLRVGNKGGMSGVLHPRNREGNLPHLPRDPFPSRTKFRARLWERARYISRAIGSIPVPARGISPIWPSLQSNREFPHFFFSSSSC